MKVLHVIPSLSPSQGGPSLALPAMARALVSRGVEVDVVTTDDDGPGRRLVDAAPGEARPREGFRVFYLPKQTEFYKTSIPLLGWLIRNINQYDLVHIHAVFTFATLAAGWAARSRGVPYIVRPLGVLNSWGMQNRRRLLKKCSFRILDKPVLDHAAAIHYTSEQEQTEALGLEIRAPAKVIPLGFELPTPPSAEHAGAFRRQFHLEVSDPVILFLSRLDPKKNVELLLRATAGLPPEVRLIVAGAGEAAYVASLQALAKELGITDRVSWIGHIQGELKSGAYAAASVYILPSMSENFGIALLEAMAAGLPCISTAGVALAAEAAQEDAVKLVAPTDASALASVIHRLLQDGEARRSLGERARETAAKYSAAALGENMLGLYTEIVKHRST